MPITLQQYRENSGLDIPIDIPVQDDLQPTPKQLIEVATDFFLNFNVTQFFTLTYGSKIGIWRRMNLFARWIDNLERLQRCPLGWLRADEMRYSGLGYPAIPAHHHGILFNGSDLIIKNGESIWHSMAGDAQITPYDPNGRAIPYTLKQAFYNSGDWDIGGLKGMKRLR